MLQELLDYSQLKNGKFRKNISKFNVKEAVEMVIALQRRQAMYKNISLTAEFINISDQEVQDSLQYSPIIETDKSRFMQVLLCLQSNAVKFTQDGFIKIVVEITTSNSNTHV